jgi:hypothetical protein
MHGSRLGVGGELDVTRIGVFTDKYEEARKEKDM